jgi:Tfp pilus assembly protein PilF
LLAVTAGCSSAFFWTLFPGTVRDRSVLRKGLGTSLYILANYYSCIKAIFQLKLKDSDSDSAQLFLRSNERLTKIRRHLYIKQITIAERLNEHSSFQNWEPNLGGRFPHKTYNNISHTIQK